MNLHHPLIPQPYSNSRKESLSRATGSSYIAGSEICSTSECLCELAILSEDKFLFGPTKLKSHTCFRNFHKHKPQNKLWTLTIT